MTKQKKGASLSYALFSAFISKIVAALNKPIVLSCLSWWVFTFSHPPYNTPYHAATLRQSSRTA
jgi:hypothetical protein